MGKAAKRKNGKSPAAGAEKRPDRPSGTRQKPLRTESPGQAGGKTELPYVRYYYWVSLGLIFLFVVAVRTRLLDLPFERDEGEYAYLGQLIRHGIAPYGIAYNMKLPGTHFMYALIMSLFGESITGVHLGLMLMNCLTILMVYKIGAKVVGSFAGVIAACAYAVLSLDMSVLGSAAHATHFVIFWAMTGLLILLYAVEKDNKPLHFTGGVLLSLAFMMKQPGVFLLFSAPATSLSMVFSRKAQQGNGCF